MQGGVADFVMHETAQERAPVPLPASRQSRVARVVRASPRARRVRLSIRSWLDHSVGTVDVVGISLGLAGELEELRQREVELVGGQRPVDLRA